MDKWEKQHYKNMDEIEKAIERLFFSLDFELSYFVKATYRGTPGYTKSQIFKAKLDDLEKRLHDGVMNLIGQGVELSDYLSNTKSKDVIAELTKANKELEIAFAKEYTTNAGDAERYFNFRKKSGFDISERIWDLSGQRKAEMTDAVGTALGEGSSADALAKSIQKYLKDPNKVFRRVRDENGDLVDSQVRKDYHPGQGVYKSSRANAYRLSRTEINIAYRSADNERWQQQDFIKAVDVKLSNSHPECDICNYFVGRYPKDFRFVSFHPSCLCYAVPVLLTKQELSDYEDYLIGIKDKPFIHYETEIPQRAADYIRANRERILGWKNQPYWLKDNPDYIKPLLAKN